MDLGNNLEHFSLRWNNFNDNMKSGFHDLLKTEDFVDVTIAAEGKLIQAHKMVLSVCSPYFKNIFKTNPCQHPVIFLKDVSHKELAGILQFMYLGEVSVQQEELGRFLKTAEALQIKGLTRNDSEEENESISDSSKEKINHKTKLSNNCLSEKQISSKKMKFNSINDTSNWETDVKNLTEVEVEKQKSNFYIKTEPTEIELSYDTESDKISLKEDFRGSLLQIENNNSDTKDDDNPDAKCSGLAQDDSGGIGSINNETCDGTDGFQYLPLLTKNQGLCPICGRILQHKKNLQTHIADQHSGMFRSWPCQICNKVCKTWSALRVHTNRHHTKAGNIQFVDFGHSLS